MKIKRIISLLLAALAALPCLASCSKIASFLPGKEEITKYVNSDYHFSLTYPSYFSEIKEIPSEENKDEYRIEIRHGKKEMIAIDITYKTASNLYEFAELSGYPKDKIKPLSMTEFPEAVNSFAYDKRECPSYELPAYYIYAMTKRMLYTISYVFEHGDKDANDVCEALDFQFDVYANVPKENQFMSPLYYFANGYTGFSFPADAVIKTYPYPESTPVMTRDENTGEVEKPIYLLFRKAEVISSDSYFVMNMPESSDVLMTSLAMDEFDDRFSQIVSDLAALKITAVKFDESGKYQNENMVNYRKIYFTCFYNGKKASGTVVAGYTAMLKYFENIYVITDGADDAQLQNYMDMIHSIKI